MRKNKHPDEEVTAAFRQLQNALIAWERATGRTSLLIFRESNNPIEAGGPQPSEVCIRWQSGIPLDPTNADLSDAFLLKQFSDSNCGA